MGLARILLSLNVKTLIRDRRGLLARDCAEESGPTEILDLPFGPRCFTTAGVDWVGPFFLHSSAADGPVLQVEISTVERDRRRGRKQASMLAQK